MEKVGRNDPCPCGSGKKFKKCCESEKTQSRFHLQHEAVGEKKVAGIAMPLFKKAVQSPALEIKSIEEMEKK